MSILPRFSLATGVCLALLLGGCAAPATRPPASGTSLYDTGMQAYTAGKLDIAASQLGLVEATSNPGVPLEQVRIALAHSYQRLGRWSDCIATVNRFVQHHPQHPALTELVMLRGESWQQVAQQPGLAQSQGVDPAEALRLAQRDYDFVVNRSPESRFAADAEQQRTHLQQRLAEVELKAARQLLQAGDFAAAINRSRYLMEHFTQPALLQEALGIMADAYTGLGLHDRAAATHAIMQGSYAPPAASSAAPAPQALTSPAQTPVRSPVQMPAPQ